jgi:AcrR family transcriptional regulator
MMENKEKIQWKAYELFKRFGVRSVTMDEIAQQCGVSKKTVYQYYEDKDTLVESIIQTMINKSQDTCTNMQLESENAIQEVFMSMDMVEQMIEGVNPALMHDLRKYHTGAFSTLDKHKQEFMGELFRKNIERGIAEGLYRPEIKTDIVNAYYLHSSMLAIEQDIFPKKYTIMDIHNEISVFLLYGLATAKGAKLIDTYKLKRPKLKTV